MDCVRSLGVFASVLLLSATAATTCRAAENTAPAKITWQTDYDEAYRAAQQHGKLLFIYFQAPRDEHAARTAADKADTPTGDIVVDTLARIAADPTDRAKLKPFEFVRLPLDAATKVGDKRVVLLDHEAFAELRGGPGVAILDFAHADQPYYTYVVSVCPLTPGKYYRFQPEHLPVLLDLPAGTITHRTMVFAVRIHPERPASTQGEDSPVLADEAASHCDYQARIRVQGHQEWDSRFRRIMSRLLGTPGTPCEVVAESWPNQNLLDSCVDCVASWRQSSGHWSAVKSQHASYGYDIQRGSNGIWYATGIFSN